LRRDLRTWITVYIKKPSHGGRKLPKVAQRTSCHKPIYAGLKFGAFELVGYVGSN